MVRFLSSVRVRNIDDNNEIFRKRKLDNNEYVRNFIKINDLMYTRALEKKLCIPDNTNIKKEIFNLLHSSQRGGHHGYHKIVELIQKQFYWHDFKSDALLHDSLSESKRQYK